MQGQRLPVPDLPHQMLMYSLGNCGFFLTLLHQGEKTKTLILPLLFSHRVSPILTMIVVDRGDVWRSWCGSFSLFIQPTQRLMESRSWFNHKVVCTCVWWFFLSRFCALVVLRIAVQNMKHTPVVAPLNLFLSDLYLHFFVLSILFHLSCIIILYSCLFLI